MRNVDTKILKKAMIDADIESLLELEKVTGVNRNTLSSIFRGDQKPSYDTMAVLADVLHLTYKEIGRIFFGLDLTQT